MKNPSEFFPARVLLLAALALVSACGGAGNSQEAGQQCSTPTGRPWVPLVPGALDASHDPSVRVLQQVIETQGPLLGLSQPVPESQEIAVRIDMSENLGARGSLTLVAEATQLPPGFSGGAFAVLVSLHDGTNELINLSRSGSGNDCARRGYFTCELDYCEPNPDCTISQPSAFTHREHWEQHQIVSDTATGYPSVNIFPTCNWDGGTSDSATTPECAFNTTFFPADPAPRRLRSGTTYTAKYVLLADSYPRVANRSAGLRVTVFRKLDDRHTNGGTVDLNFILVGSRNIQASRTPRGQRNLNTMADFVAKTYSRSEANLRLGNVRAIEWGCGTEGEAFANVDASSVGEVFREGARVLGAESPSRSINVFLVSGIQDDTSAAGANLTILGIDGAIGGPPLNGTAESGMVVSTFDGLDQFNPECPDGAAICPLSQQEEAFYNLSEAVAHEMGHYLGLNHLSESSGRRHDIVFDTPVCTATDQVGTRRFLTPNSCRMMDTTPDPVSSRTCRESCTDYDSRRGRFCSDVRECQFNYLMWWSNKNFDEGTGAGDGNLISPDQAAVIQYHPFVQ